MSDIDMMDGLASRRSVQGKRLILPLLGGTSVIALIAAAGIWLFMGDNVAKDDDTIPTNPVKVERIAPKKEAPLPSPAQLLATAAPAAPATYSPAPMEDTKAAAAQSGPPEETGELVTSFDNDAPKIADRDPPAGTPGAGGAAGRPGMAAIGFKRLAMEGDEAGVVTDLAHTIKPTTRILCTLNQAINSEHEGPLTCIIKEPVMAWDINNHVPLIPKGTPVSGTYSSMNTGEKRMLAMSAMAWRSDGVAVPLGGDPMTDDLGRMGVPGNIDTRFWEKFGNAIIVDAALALINLPQAALTSRQPGTTNLNFNAGNTENVVNQVLSSTLNLPPILSVPQGRDVTILIVKPIHVPEAQYAVTR